jgi:ribosome-associated protein
MNDDQAKRLIQKLQKSIVKGLEDVKAIDVRVFNTEALSPLFERVIIASGNSNRQTKALASSVKDQLRDDGFPKPRSEGEENGEWIIVDCGAAVVHIMQPAIRQYYHLEDIWGEKPVRLKGERKASTTRSAAAKPVAKPAVKTASPSRAAGTKTQPQRAAAKKTVKAPAKSAVKPKAKTSRPKA